MPHPTPARIRRAVDTLALLGPAALAALIERLDALTPDPDLEEDNEDCCDAGDDDPASSFPCGRATSVRDVGDPDDAEDGDPAEDDDPQGDHRHDADCEPHGLVLPDVLGGNPVTGPAECGTRLRLVRDGLATVRRGFVHPSA